MWRRVLKHLTNWVSAKQSNFRPHSEYEDIKVDLISQQPFKYLPSIHLWELYSSHFTGWVQYYNSKIHFVDGLYHREDGPAVLFSNGNKTWCYNNQFLHEIKTQEQFESWLKVRAFE